MDFGSLYTIIDELITIERDDLRPVRLLVVGCSTSEIAGGKIGKASMPEYGDRVAEILLDCAATRGIDLAFQCCEHLNRALVVERRTAERYGLTEVCVVPQPKAGGSCAAAAYQRMADPVVVECIQADSALDIGDTLIGMHVMPVAIPLRLSVTHLGSATVRAARTRPKLIGGPRAVYTRDDIR